MVTMPTETETICKELTENFLLCLQTVLVLPDLFEFACHLTKFIEFRKKSCSHFCCFTAARYLTCLRLSCLRQGGESESTGYFVDMEVS